MDAASSQLAHTHSSLIRNNWSKIDCRSGDAPTGRSSLVAQVHKNFLYVFGGYNGDHVLNDFYKFRLKTIAVPPPSLVGDFQKLINNPELSDVCFLVEGKEIHAHRAVLAIRSEYFRVMLLGGMRESNHGGVERAKNSASPIDLPDVSYAVFLKVLEFLYTDTVRNVSLETGVHLLIASELFMLDRLKALCEDLIRRDVSVDSVIGILVAAHRHNASALKDIALEYILLHLNNPSIQAGLSDLRVEPDLLLEIIKRSTKENNSGVGNARSANYTMDTSGPFAWNEQR